VGPASTPLAEGQRAGRRSGQTGGRGEGQIAPLKPFEAPLKPFEASICSVYKVKPFLRELADDRLRSITTAMNAAEFERFVDQVTRLGKALQATGSS
jgi:hypothetical protein